MRSKFAERTMCHIGLFKSSLDTYEA